MMHLSSYLIKRQTGEKIVAFYEIIKPDGAPAPILRITSESAEMNQRAEKFIRDSIVINTLSGNQFCSAQKPTIL